MKAHLLSALVAVATIATSCSSLNSGAKFTKTIDGHDFQFEVIISKMSYVRLVGVSEAVALSGSVEIPAQVNYDRTNYKVTQIGRRVFRDCTDLTSVTLPKTLSIIEAEAFQGCTALADINTPQPLSVIGRYAFDGCASLTYFSLDASISELGEGALRNCAGLTSLKFTPSFTKIPDALCQGCTALKDITLPATILSVGAEAFQGCTSVRSITIDRSLQTIGSEAFQGCTGVETITCMTPTPPACPSNTFDGISPDVPVTVPISNVNDYKAAPGWNHFHNYTGRY